MSKVILTQSQLEFLESVISEFGTLVIFDQIVHLAPGQNEQSKRRFIAQLTKIGWLVRIKKGIYQVADLTTLGTITLSRYVVAGILVPESYISFESALQLHGLHDQLLRTTTSVSLKQHSKVVLEGYGYQYVKTQEEFFFGYQEHTIDGQQAQIAGVEKALIDLIQLHRTDYTVDRVTEVLADESSEIDTVLLQEFLQRSTLTTQRIFGLIFDRLGVTYGQELVHRSRDSLAVSKVTADSQDFDAKWRLYYDTAVFDRYASV